MSSFKLEKTNIFILSLLIIGVGGLFFFHPGTPVGARGLGHLSDTVTHSGPSASSSHEIKFIATVSIPPAGRIAVIPQAGQFDIPADFDYEEVDIATATDLAAAYTEREVAAAADSGHDGVTVISGINGSVTIILNSSSGITAGEAVRIRLGQNAQYGATGTAPLVNPATAGTYRLDLVLYDAAMSVVGSYYALIAIIEPVTFTAKSEKIRFNGSPSGNLAAGTTETYLSLNTNYPATCRFSTTSDIDYFAMANQFIFSDGFFHSLPITGLTAGEYNFYVRCIDEENVPNIDDYLIHFTIREEDDVTGDGEGDEGGDGTGGSSGPGAGGGSGGGMGSGTGPGSGELLPYPPLPGNPSVEFFGWAYPKSEVNVLKDGTETAKASADILARFSVPVYELKEGVYTFGIWSKDSDGRKSITYTSTFWIKQGTKSVISNIILPPTIEVNSRNIDPGETLRIFGQSAPSSTVEVWLVPDDEARKGETVILPTIAAFSGKWEVIVQTGNFQGIYQVKAKTKIAQVGQSEFGQVILVGIGEEVAGEVCAGADLNGDGRVNLTDFSILLYWWGSADDCADQNDDGKVDLIDFSIMMFYWTG